MVPPSALNFSGAIPAAVITASASAVVPQPRSPATMRFPLRSWMVLIGLSLGTNSAMTATRPRLLAIRRMFLYASL